MTLRIGSSTLRIGGGTGRKGVAVAPSVASSTVKWANNKNGRAHAFMGDEPDYVSTLAAEYTTNGGSTITPLTLESYGTLANGSALRSTVRVTAALAAGTYNLQARWVIDGAAEAWSPAQSVTVTNAALATANSISYGSGNEITLSLGATVPVGQFEDGEWFAVADPATHPSGIKVTASTPAAKRIAATGLSYGDAHNLIADNEAFDVVWSDGTTTRRDRITRPVGGWTSANAARDDWNSKMVNTGAVWSTTLASGTHRFSAVADFPVTSTLGKLSFVNVVGTPLDAMGFVTKEWKANIRHGASVDVEALSHGLREGHNRFTSTLVYDFNTFITPGQVFVKVQTREGDTNNYVSRLLTLTVLSRRPPEGSFRPTVYKSGDRKLYNWTHCDLGRVPRVNYDSAAMPTLAEITSYRLGNTQRPAPSLGTGSLDARRMYPSAQSQPYHQHQRSSWAFPCVMAMASAANLEAAATASGAANPAVAAEAERVALVKAHIQRMIDVFGAEQSIRNTGKTEHPYLWIAPLVFAATILGEPKMRGAGDIAFGKGDYNFDANGYMWHLFHWSDLDWKAANSNVTGQNTLLRNISKTGANPDAFVVTKASQGISDNAEDNASWPDVWAPLKASRTVCTYTPTRLAEEKADLEARGLTVVDNLNGTLTVTAPANRTWYGGRFVWFEHDSHRCSQESLLYPWAERPTNADGTRVDLSGSRIGWGDKRHGKTYDQQHRYFNQHAAQASTMAIIANAVAGGPYMAKRTSASGNTAKFLQDGQALEWMAFKQKYMLAAGAKSMADNFGRIDLDQTVPSSKKGWIENGYGTRFPSFAPTFTITAPAKITRQMFTVASNGAGGITFTLTDAPHDGYSPITDIEVSRNGGAWVSTGLTKIGNSYTIASGPGTFNVAVRAKNATGVGPASGTKSVTV